MVRDSLRKFLSVPLHSNKDAEKRVHQLTTLIEITQQLTSRLELEPLLQYILENAVQILNCDAGSLFLVDEQTQELVLKVGVGPIVDQLLGKRIPPATGIAGRVMQMRQPLIENDVQHSDDYYRNWDQQTAFMTHSLIAVPMQVKDRVTGLIEVFNRRGGLPFAADDQSLLTVFAAQAAVAIENARLFQISQVEEEKIRELNLSLEKRVEERTLQLEAEKSKIEQFAQDVQCLRALTNFLQACLTIEETAGIISDHMSNLFPSTSGSLFLASESSPELAALTHWGDISTADELDPTTCWGLRRSRAYIRQGRGPLPRCSHYRNELPEETMCLPLLVQGDVIGLICIERMQHEDHCSFTQEMQNLAIASADSIALALGNLRLRERLQYQAIRDPLTGLYNGRFMEETLDREVHRAMRSGHPLSIIFLEIDNFRIYNNTYGHDAGNYVVRKLSDAIRCILRRSDFPCRYGGDEFTILLPETSLNAAAQKAEELRRSVQALALTYNNQTLGTVTISVGVASFPQHGETGEAVVKIADAASYKAKAAGKNCVVVAE